MTKEDFEKIQSKDIIFVNNFILNFKINNERIVNKNYFSNIVINYNEELIIDYLVKNKINFIDHLPSKFLVIILEENNFKHNLLSKENSFYKYLATINHEYGNNFFIIPNLDHNDRYIFDKNIFVSDVFTQNNKLSNKYGTKYQILVHSVKNNGFFINNVFLFYDNKKYLVIKNKINGLSYENFFKQIKISSLDKWKDLNKIDTDILNKLDCKIEINNISELIYVRKKFEKNIIIKNFNLKTVKLNESTYKIFFFGHLNIFINSLKRDRMKLFINDNICNIKLI